MNAVSLVERDAWIAAVLSSEGLSLGTKLVGTRIALHLNRQTGRCDPSVATLCSGVALTTRAVEKAITVLEKGGWLVRGRGAHRSNKYVLRLPEGFVPVAADGIDPVAGDGVEASDPVRTDGVKPADPVATDGLTPSSGTGLEPSTPSVATGVPRPQGRTNLESNQRSPLTPQASGRRHPIQGPSIKVRVPIDDPRWSDFANAHRRRTGHAPPTETMVIDGRPQMGWAFDPSLLDLPPIPSGYRPPYLEAAE